MKFGSFTIVLVCIAMISNAATDAGDQSRVNEIRAAYATVRAELANKYPEPTFGKDTSELSKMLNRAWFLVAELASVYLQVHTGANETHLKNEIESLDPEPECDESDHDC